MGKLFFLFFLYGEQKTFFSILLFFDTCIIDINYFQAKNQIIAEGKLILKIKYSKNA